MSSSGSAREPGPRGAEQPGPGTRGGGLSGITRPERALIAAIVVVSALAGVLRYVHGVSHVVAFIVAAFALAGLAWLVSFGTEQVGARFGAAATGLMQSSLGNLPEFFVVFFALQARDVVVAQTAIVGSILVNALLVLGFVLIAGALNARDGVMRFSARLPNDTATLLLIATFIIVLIGLTNASHDPASHHNRTISIVGAVAILVVYGWWLRQYLTTESAGARARHRRPGCRRPSAWCCSALAASGRPSCRTGSCTRSSRRSTPSTSPGPSRAW